MALTVSRAMTRPPMAAWTGTSNSCRGMFSFSFSHSRRARGYALSLWAMKLRASTISPFSFRSTFTSSLGR